MCKYCEENISLYECYDASIFIQNKILYVEDITEFGDLFQLEVEILFCPMCGQKLD